MKTNFLASQLFERNLVRDNITGPRYERHLNCVDSAEDSSSTDSQPELENGINNAGTPNARCRKEVHLAFLPANYQPLMVYDEEREKVREEKKKRKKEKYKKVRKNVRKALKCTWRCLMLGLYNFALGYSTPMSVVTTFSPDFHQGQNWP
ncbi:required for drug-induced death protein 1-like [Boleophthalmus pectinirostris]|uniref:required for drug-induced death protein 1-like n=1 Tax=Boleophthalmus pectinirostris TaxID=150288 RepID=UPI000A1C72F0|nr:required for drug-induced death protein 1-like [Boleophthalmus pectinirostris]